MRTLVGHEVYWWADDNGICPAPPEIKQGCLVRRRGNGDLVVDVGGDQLAIVKRRWLISQADYDAMAAHADEGGDQ